MAEPSELNSIIQEIVDARVDMQSFEEFMSVAKEVMISRRLAGDVHSMDHYLDYLDAIKLVFTQANGDVTVGDKTVKSLSQLMLDAALTLERTGGNIPYPTYAAMVANKASITNKMILEVLNDTDATKNGKYTYDGVSVFTKSAYDPLTQAKAYTDTNKADTLLRVQNVFATKALMTASSLVDGSNAQVNNDVAVDNNGLYVKTAGAWVKSAYDPLTQAKTYTDAAKSEAITGSKNYTDAEILKLANKSSGTFDTLALLTASTLADNAYALVANETDLTKNGYYKKLAGVWTRVKYDPVAIAAVDAIAKANAAEANAKDYVDEKIKISLDNIEGELYEIVDLQGNILAQVEPDGTWVLPAIRTTTLDSTGITGDNLNLRESTEADITKEKLIRIPEQNYLRLDLSFVSLPTDLSTARLSKTGTCIISDSSKSIVYARTNAEMSVQGHGSAGDKKKNYTIDFYNIDGDELELKFGDSIASDSYHLKGFYRDPTHMRDQGGHRCWKELVQKLDYPYSKINNIVYSASPSRPTNAEFTADAKYYPHGFPVEVYLNSEFYGLYTLRLKKARNNYALNNANTNHIFLDSGTYAAYLKEPFDATDWEIKSPKMSGYEDLGLIPPAFTETVGASCTRLFEFTRTLSTSYPNHADYIVLPHWILWYLMCELTGDWDHSGNNYNIITWNNQQWSIIPYDLDWTLNWFTNGFGNIQSTNLLSTDIWTTFRNVFTPEIKSLWTKYRKNGDISVEKVVKHYRNAVSNVPRKIYKADKDNWGSFPTFENVNYPDLEQVYRWFEARIAFLDSKYLIV